MNKQTYRVIGVMSGTSLDGIDLCEVEFSLENNQWSFDIHKTKTLAYPQKWVDALQKAHHLSKPEVYKLDENYTAYLAEVISAFMKNPDVIDMICSHGHTIWHQPEKGFTYQIGNLPFLAEKIAKTVVCDFRTADVELGGQGAPLVPIGDRLLFAEYDYCVNIGGFVNISFEQKDKRIAFDICPANKILNYYTQKLGLAYDDKGEIAIRGSYNKALFEALNALEFYKNSPPKSLGIEWLETQFLPIVESYDILTQDKLNTLCHHIGYQISKVLKNNNECVLISGGGAYHDYLIECIKSYANTSKIIIPNPKIIDYKEALIFGLLGILKYRGDFNVLSSVTGSDIDHCSGKIYTISGINKFNVYK